MYLPLITSYSAFSINPAFVLSSWPHPASARHKTRKTHSMHPGLVELSIDVIPLLRRHTVAKVCSEKENLKRVLAVLRCSLSPHSVALVS